MRGCILGACFLLGAGTAVRGGGLDVSGFIDYRYVDAEDGDGGFLPRPGNGLEVSVAANLTEYAVAQATFVSGGDALALGPTFLDIHFGTPEGHATHGSVTEHSGLMVGFFDVPFGIESRYYSSADRPSIAAPSLTTSLLGGGWTDVGVHWYAGYQCGLEGCTVPLALDLVLVGGFLWDNGTDGTFGTVDDVGLGLPLVSSTNGRTVGGRIGYRVADGVELGISYANGSYRADVSGVEPRMALAGADFTFARDRLSVRGEYARFTGDNPGAADLGIRTWYIEPVFAVNDAWNVYGRFDEITFQFDRDGNGALDEGIRSVLGGVRYRLADNVHIRCEAEHFHPGNRAAVRPDAVRASVVASY